MAKNIILCSDGTGNTAVKGRGTNVFKLFEAVDLNGHQTNAALDPQLAFYDDGVGTQGMTILRLLGGAAGLGLARNVRKLYRELSRVYDEGDRIFLFGFSRGAFTVRTLAGMIGACGVLRGESYRTARELSAAVDAAYRAYRSRYESTLTKVIGLMRRPAPDPLAAFLEHHKPRRDVRVTFIGVWDTVDAVGMPFALADVWNRRIVQFKFPSQTLGSHIEHACHALSLDDDRLAFEPVLWQVPDGDKRIEQVWFSGVHSNVGGGYPKQGMSLVALDWMLCHAAERGLRLQALDHDIFRGHASVDDMMYDPRAGVGVFYRWAPRDVRDYCAKSGIKPCVHMSVAERIAHGTDDYAPGNIPPDVTVATTPPLRTDPQWATKQAVLQSRAGALETAIRQAHVDSGYLLDCVRPQIARGDRSYWAFMLGWLLVIVLGSGALARILGVDIPGWWLGPPLFVTIVLFLAALWLSRKVDARISDTFSEFWQSHQKDLRAALKDAHQKARAGAASPGRDDRSDSSVGLRIGDSLDGTDALGTPGR